MNNERTRCSSNGDFILKGLTGFWLFSSVWLSLRSLCPPPPGPAAAPIVSIRGQRVFVGHRAAEGGVLAWTRIPHKAPGPPLLYGVGQHSHSNGYGSDIKEGVCSELLRGAKKPHHGVQVDITTQAAGLNIPIHPYQLTILTNGL